MARKIFTWILLILSGLFLLLSVAGIVAIWIYRQPLTNEANRRLGNIDLQLIQAQGTLDSSQKELERALRIVDSAQAGLDKIKAQTNSTGNFLETIQSTLDDKLLPDLKTTRSRIDSAKVTLQQLQSILKGISGFIPGLDLSSPDKILADLVTSANSLNGDITNIEALGTQVSVFLGDSSFLLNGDLTETRTSLQNFVEAIKNYKTKVAGWRDEVATLKEGAPRWINQAAIALTIFLLWFGISQMGLFLHGMTMLRGGDPFLALRRTKVEVRTDGIVREESIESLERENDSLT
jgi:hypothetical protein